MTSYRGKGERNLVINHRSLHYNGIFHVKEVFEILNSALLEKEYTLRDKRNEEVVSESGKNYYLELRPFKDVTDYVTLMQKIVIRLRNVKKIEQEMDDHVQNFDVGEVEIVFDAWSLTDYEARWGMKPGLYFFKALINQWFYQFSRDSGFTGELREDTGFIYSKLKDLFASYRRKDRKYVSEVDVRGEIEKEILESEKNNPEQIK